MLSSRIGLLLLNQQLRGTKGNEITYFLISTIYGYIINLVERIIPSFFFESLQKKELVASAWILYLKCAVCFTFFFYSSTFARALRERNVKRKSTAINARLCRSMLLHTYNHCVWNKKKETQPVCERERVSERVSERGEWE